MHEVLDEKMTNHTHNFILSGNASDSCVEGPADVAELLIGIFLIEKCCVIVTL